MQITQHHLAFMEEAKNVFANDVRRETHFNKVDDLIALRQGMDRDCIEIYELGQNVAFFAQMIPKSNSPLKGDIRTEVQWFALRMEEKLKENDHKDGWDNLSNNLLNDFLDDQVAKMRKAFAENRLKDHMKHSYNAANYLMMIADNAANAIDGDL